MVKWLNIGRQSIDSTGALPRLGAIVFEEEFKKIAIEKIIGKQISGMPNVYLQIERPSQQTDRSVGCQLGWDSLTMPVAYEQAPIARITPDSIVETARPQVGSWFEKTISLVETQNRPYLKRRQRGVVLAQETDWALCQLSKFKAMAKKKR